MQLSSLYQLEIAAMDGEVTDDSFEAAFVNFLINNKRDPDYFEIQDKALFITLRHRDAVYPLLIEFVKIIQPDLYQALA